MQYPVPPSLGCPRTQPARAGVVCDESQQESLGRARQELLSSHSDFPHVCISYPREAGPNMQQMPNPDTRWLSGLSPLES